MGLYRSLCQRKASAWIRLASLALSAFLLSQLIFSPGAWAAESSYSDTRGEECEDAVALLSEKGVINGYEDGTFRPDHQITRAEVAKIFSSLIVGEDTEIVLSEDADLSGLVFPSEEEQEEEGKSPQEDQEKSSEEKPSDMEEQTDAEVLAKKLSQDLHDSDRLTEIALTLYNDLDSCVWAQPYIASASLCGIVNGYGSGIFKPSGNITYNELAAMCVRAAGTDTSELAGSWPDSYIAAAQELGMYKGMKEFDPKEDDGSAAATRGNTAIAVSNIYHAAEEQSAKGYLFPDELISVVFAQDAAELSLEKAVEIMQTEGLQAESAQLARESDKAIAQGYKETAKTISDSLDIADLLPLDQQYQLQESGVTQSNLKITQLQRDFVKENIDNNYQADMNKIEQTTEQLYFGLLQAQENVKVCEETLISEENTLNLLKKKYELGAASKLEVQSQENNVLTAQDSLTQAQNTFQSTQSNFLMLMGMDAGRKLNLTTELTKAVNDLPSLNDAQEYMLKNSLELKYYEYLTELTKIQFESLRSSTNSNSSKYLKAKSAYDQAQMGIEQMKLNKKNSLQTAYEKIPALESQITRYDSMIRLAEDSLELAKTRYEIGMGTLSDIESAQLSVTQAKLGRISAVVAYNQAISDAWYEIGIGTTRISFS